MKKVWKYYLAFGIVAEGAAYVGAVLAGMRAIQGGTAAASAGPVGGSYLEIGMLLAGLPAVAYIAAMGFLYTFRLGSKRTERPTRRRAQSEGPPYPRATTAEDIMVLGIAVWVLLFVSLDFGLNLPLLDALFAATVAAVGLYRWGVVRLSKRRRMLNERQRAGD